MKELNKEVSFCIWDTAGQECFFAMTKRYYKGANAALIVFSMTDRDSYNQIGSWYDRIRSECGDIPIILVMSKIDLDKEIAVTEIDARQFSVSMGLDLVLCSSKKGIMVNELFENLGIKYYHSAYNISKGREEGMQYDYNEDNAMDSQSEYIFHKTFKLKIASKMKINEDRSNHKKKKTC